MIFFWIYKVYGIKFIFNSSNDDVYDDDNNKVIMVYIYIMFIIF